MDELNVGVLPVCDGRRLVGMVTDRDITVRSAAAGEQPDRVHVGEIMSRHVRWCFEDTPVERAERMMGEVQIRRLPVVDHAGNLVGIVTLGDLAEEQAPGTKEALRRVSQPSEPERSETLSASRSAESASGRPRAGAPAESREDHALRTEVNRRLKEDAELDATNIHVFVEHGQVTLAGTVGSEEDRGRAEEIARAASNTGRVRNALSIVEESTTGNPAGSAADLPEGQKPRKR